MAAVARRRRRGRAVEPRRRGGRRSRGSCPGRTRRARAARSSGDEESVPCLVRRCHAYSTSQSSVHLKYATHNQRMATNAAHLSFIPLTPCSTSLIFTLSFVHRAAAGSHAFLAFSHTRAMRVAACSTRRWRTLAVQRSKIVIVQKHTRARH